MNTDRITSRLLFAAVLLCAVPLATFSPAEARDHSAGRPAFEEAYAAEKEHPETAIELYQKSIRMGLSPELKKAARWRLFYLYRKAGQYGEALETAGHLGSDNKLKNVLEDLYEEIAGTFKISDSAAREYAAGLKLIAQDRDDESAIHFERALAAHSQNENLRRDIISRLIGRGRSSAALALLQKVGRNGNGGNGSAELARADLLVKLKRGPEAHTILFDLARVPEKKLTAAERSHLLYLLGRVARRRDDPGAAVHYFRMAAMQADDSDLRGRMQGLASYELYRENRKLQARALLQGMSDTDDADVNLLELVLRVEVDGETDAMNKLRAMVPELERSKRSFLVNEALRLAGSSNVSKGNESHKESHKQPRAETDQPPGKSEAPEAAPGSEIIVQPEFWQREFQENFGETIRIPVPEDHKAVLYRNPDALQFQGYSRSRGRLRAVIESPLVLPENIGDLRDLLTNYRGNFVLLIVPQEDEATDEAIETNPENGESANPAGETTPLSQKPTPPAGSMLASAEAKKDRPWYVLNVHSDGTGNLLVDLEENAGLSRLPGYVRATVKTIQLVSP